LNISQFISEITSGIRNAMKVLGYHNDYSFTSNFPIIYSVMIEFFSYPSDYNELFKVLQQLEELISFLENDKKFCELYEHHHLNEFSDGQLYLLEHYHEIIYRYKNMNSTFDDFLKVNSKTIGHNSQPIYFKGNQISLSDSGEDNFFLINQVGE
jgi:hypothetical protein